jgi:ABC-type multidrug transport system ATPase subunit
VVGDIETHDLTILMEGFPILDEVSVTFPRGRSTIVMGPSGSGKSTLIKAAAGIVPVSSGDVRYGGVSILNLSDRQNIALQRDSGFVFQDSALWENRSVYQNVALPLEYHFRDLPPSQIEERVRRLLHRMDLAAAAGRRPAYISAGERKVVSFCRALITEPDIVFMDEPTMSIDRGKLNLVFDMIRELKQEGRTLITVTHDPKLTSWLADYLVVLREGRLVEQGEFAAVRNSANAVTQAVLTDVMSEAAAYDDELLDLLGEATPWIGQEEIVDTETDGGLE